MANKLIFRLSMIAAIALGSASFTQADQSAATMTASVTVPAVARILEASASEVRIGAILAPNSELRVWRTAGTCDPAKALAPQIITTSGIHEIYWSEADKEAVLVCAISTDGALRASAPVRTAQ